MSKDNLKKLNNILISKDCWRELGKSALDKDMKLINYVSFILEKIVNKKVKSGEQIQEES